MKHLQRLSSCLIQRNTREFFLVVKRDQLPTLVVRGELAKPLAIVNDIVV